MKNLIDALPYLPQTQPFVLVDGLIEVKGSTFISTFCVPKQHSMVRNGYLTAGGLLEHMAQTLAAGTGYQASLMNMRPVPGYIANIKNVVIQSLPSVNRILITKMVVTSNLGNILVADGVVQSENKSIASATFTVLIQEKL